MRPRVPRLYTEKDNGLAFCIAPGPSILRTDLRHIYELPTGHTVITINDAYRWYPYAPFRFAGDGYWWAQRTDAYAPTRYGGECYCLEYGAPGCVKRLDHRSDIVLSEHNSVLATGGHSGYAAINFAYLTGAKTIVLYGYDMQPSQSGPTAGDHHYGGDEPGQRHLRYHLWLPRYRPLREALDARGVRLVNCTPHTAISEMDVPRAPLDSVL